MFAAVLYHMCYVSSIPSAHTHIVEDQVAEVYRDFEAAAQVDPERMKRRSQASSDSSSIAGRDLK